jgi:hypothetical protein
MCSILGFGKTETPVPTGEHGFHLIPVVADFRVTPFDNLHDMAGFMVG